MTVRLGSEGKYACRGYRQGLFGLEADVTAGKLSASISLRIGHIPLLHVLKAISANYG